MHLHESGVTLVYIREILGYVSIKTTDIKARADSKAKREARKRANRDVEKFRKICRLSCGGQDFVLTLQRNIPGGI